MITGYKHWQCSMTGPYGGDNFHDSIISLQCWSVRQWTAERMGGSDRYCCHGLSTFWLLNRKDDRMKCGVGFQVEWSMLWGLDSTKNEHQVFLDYLGQSVRGHCSKVSYNEEPEYSGSKLDSNAFIPTTFCLKKKLALCKDEMGNSKFS